MAEQLASVRRLYEIENISNKVVDGREPYPENHQMLNDGISVEFRWISYPLYFLDSQQLMFLYRNVSFKYPGTEKYALKNISFKIEPGHLCVCVCHSG
jgi:ABC-type multidrug transport system fused ATPase/permease subunit